VVSRTLPKQGWCRRLLWPLIGGQPGPIVGGPTNAAGLERVLERVMEAFHHPIGLWMVCCCPSVLDVEQAAQGGGELSAPV